MSTNPKQKQRKQLFYLGILIFALGIILPATHTYDVPSPIESPAYQDGGTTYFFPFLNWLTIGGILLAVAVLVLSRRSKADATQ